MSSSRGGQQQQRNTPNNQSSNRDNHSKERGFETFIQGANQHRVTSKRQTEKQTTDASRQSSSKERERKKWEEAAQQPKLPTSSSQSSKNALDRKKWGQVQQYPSNSIIRSSSNSHLNSQQQHSGEEQHSIEEEYLEQFIDSMRREDFEILRESLHQESKDKGKASNRISSLNASYEKKSQGRKSETKVKGKLGDDHQEDFWGGSDDFEIEEEIEDTIVNDSDVIPKTSLTNKKLDRVLSGQPQRMQYGVDEKKRPISAVVESEFSLKKDQAFSEFQTFQENELTKELNSKPFSKKTLTEGVSSSSKLNQESSTQPRSQSMKQFSLQKEVGLDKLFSKISKLSEGERGELEVLIDKIDSGELNVQALKGLLFLQANASLSETPHRSFNNHSSQQQSSFQSQNLQNQRSNQARLHPQQSSHHDELAESCDYPDEYEKPETIRFSTLMKNQLASSLLSNTNALEKSLREREQKENELDDRDKQFPLKNGKMIEEDSLQPTREKKNLRFDIPSVDSPIARNSDQIESKQKSLSNRSTNVPRSADDIEGEDNQSRKSKSIFKDTLDLRREPVTLIAPITQPDDAKRRYETTATTSGASTTIASSSSSNRTFNFSKNRDKVQSATSSLHDIRENKGEVFIIIRVISTWGSVHLAGFTEIKVYDDRGIQVDLKAENFLIEGGPQTSLRNIHRLCDGVVSTTNSDHMWVGTMPDPPRCLEIGVLFKSSHGLGGMKIWNYNKSLIDSMKGVKEVQITRNRQLIYEGQIRQGIGKEQDDYCHVIKFKEGILFVDDEKPFKSLTVRMSLQKLIPQGSSNSKAGEPSNIASGVTTEATPSAKNSRRGSTGLSSTTVTSSPNVDTSTKQIQTSSVSSTASSQPRIRSAQVKVKEAEGTMESKKQIPRVPTAIEEDNDSLSLAVALLSKQSRTTPVTGYSDVQKDIQFRGESRTLGSLRDDSDILTAAKRKGPKVLGDLFEEKQQPTLFEKSSSMYVPKEQTVFIKEKEQFMTSQPPIEVEQEREWLMEKVRLFDASHHGRFIVAERERVLQQQADDVKESVEQALKQINPFLESNNNLEKEDSSRKRVIVDPKVHFGFEDSDEYSALDVFLDFKKKGINTTTDQRVTTLSSAPISSSLKGGSHDVANIKQKQKSVFEDTMIEELLNERDFEEGSRAIQSARNVFAEQTKKGNSTVKTTVAPTNHTEAGSKKNDKSSFDENFLAFIPVTNKRTTTFATFAIPNLPQGKSVRIEILSTWGDRYYVGLSGVEFFGADGRAINISGLSVRAVPSDINVLVEYGADPRTCDKLVDGSYVTSDDLHMWLAPFSEGEMNKVFIELPFTTRLAMIRVWNYNKSRIHSSRGAKAVRIYLDDVPIFAGEIKKAPGNKLDAADEAEYIMFTDSSEVIETIQENDWLNVFEMPRIEEEQSVLDELLRTQTLKRPNTANVQATDLIEKNAQDALLSEELKESLSAIPRSLINKDGRPMTTAKLQASLIATRPAKITAAQAPSAIVVPSLISRPTASKKRGIRCKKLRINLLKGWEDRYLIGLTGLEFFDEWGNVIPLTMKNINAWPRDLSTMNGHEQDQRRLENLINGVNKTTLESQMWVTQLTEENCILIDFKEERVVSGIKVWNFNKIQKTPKAQEPYKGVKLISLVADDTIPLTSKSGVQLRKAPGKDSFDYGQLIPLPYERGWTREQIDSLKLPASVATNIVQEYDTLYLPRGFCFRLQLHSTWGDAHYIGLNGIEFYDSFGAPIISSGSSHFSIIAEPSSVNDLVGRSSNLQPDIRTVDKLVNGENNTFNDRNMWLAPFMSQHTERQQMLIGNQQAAAAGAIVMNSLVVTFNNPVAVSAVNIWNYSKTPTRGVREIEVFCDDALVFRGFLKRAPSEEVHQKTGEPLYSTIVFNRNPLVLKSICPLVYNEDRLEQAVAFFNEGTQIAQNQRRDVQFEEGNFSVEQERPATKVLGTRA